MGYGRIHKGKKMQTAKFYFTLPRGKKTGWGDVHQPWGALSFYEVMGGVVVEQDVSVGLV